jgi:hypothetical protein
MLSGLSLVLARPWIANRLYNNLWLVRWLLAPYLGLICGGVSPRLMGLTAIDWRTSLSFGVATICGVLLVLALVQATTATPGDPGAAQLTEKAPSAALPSAAIYALRFLQSGAEEFHWAFLRGSLWELLLDAPNVLSVPAYAAVWLAAGLAGLGILVTHSGLMRMSKGIVLIATTILFFYTRNFWLCWLLHGAAWSIIQQQPANRSPGLAQK